MKRVAVCGWDQQTAALLRAIAQRTDLRPVAIGDDRPAALVRARTATGLPCYQHLREMLRAVDYDAVLIGEAADPEALLQLAAEHRASILLRGDVANARTLRAAADAVSAGAAGLNILRPELNHAGFDLLTGLTTGDAGWEPYLVQIDLSAALGMDVGLNAAAGLIARLQPEPASQVIASAVRDRTDLPTTASIQVRHGEHALTVLTLHGHPDDSCRIVIEAPTARAEFTNRTGTSALVLEPAGAVPERSELVDDDLLDLEALRLADPASRRLDERLAPHEAALLTAIDGSLHTGFVAPVRDPGARGNLRVLEGGQLTTSPRAGHLRVVG